MALVDRSGIPVQFTGFLHADSGKPHGKGMMIWPRTGDKFEGRFEQGGKGYSFWGCGCVFGRVATFRLAHSTQTLSMDIPLFQPSSKRSRPHAL